MSRAKKLIFRLQVNIGKANSRKYDVINMTLPGRWYIQVPAKIFNPHIRMLYVFCEVKFKVKCFQMN